MTSSTNSEKKHGQTPSSPVRGAHEPPVKFTYRRFALGNIPTMRLFFSLPVPEPIRVKLAAIQEEFKYLDANRALRFVEPELFHFTLAFLGERPQTELPRLLEVGAKVASYHPAMEISCDGLATFPGRSKRLGVLFAYSSQVISLSYATHIEAGLSFTGRKQSADIRMPEILSAHVTLARGKSLAMREPFESLLGERQIGAWKADRLQLVESRLGEQNRYRVVEEFELKNQGWGCFMERFPGVSAPWIS